MPQSTFFQNNSPDKMGCTGFRTPSAGCGADKVILPGLEVFASAVIELFTTIRAADNTGEHIALSGSCRAAFILPKFLYTVEGFFVHNRIMGILENLPFGLRIFDFLFAFVGLPVCTEVDHVAQIFRFFQYS
jgi:hypothetical protein